MFAWRLIRDRLPTKMNLRRRQVMVNDSMCPLCGLNEEKASHLFFSCSNTLPLWWESLSWVNLATTLPQNARDNYMQHETEIPSGKKLTRWKCWWIALTWAIWNHKNKIVFQNQTFDGRKMMDDAVLLLWTWIKSMKFSYILTNGPLTYRKHSVIRRGWVFCNAIIECALAWFCVYTRTNHILTSTYVFLVPLVLFLINNIYIFAEQKKKCCRKHKAIH